MNFRLYQLLISAFCFGLDIMLFMTWYDHGHFSIFEYWVIPLLFTFAVVNFGLAMHPEIGKDKKP